MMNMPFVVERCGNGTVRNGVVEDHAVDFRGRHAGLDFTFYQIEYAGIDHPAASYAFDLFGRLYQFPAGYETPVILKIQYFLVEFGKRGSFGDFPVIDDFP